MPDVNPLEFSLTGFVQVAPMIEVVKLCMRMRDHCIILTEYRGILKLFRHVNANIHLGRRMVVILILMCIFHLLDGSNLLVVVIKLATTLD